MKKKCENKAYPFHFTAEKKKKIRKVNKRRQNWTGDQGRDLQWSSPGG